MKYLAIIISLALISIDASSAENFDVKQRLITHHTRLFAEDLTASDKSKAKSYNFTRQNPKSLLAKEKNPIRHAFMKSLIQKTGNRALPKATTANGITTIKFEKYKIVRNPISINSGVIFINSKAFTFGAYATINEKINAFAKFLNQFETKKVSVIESILSTFIHDSIADHSPAHTADIDKFNSNQQHMILSLFIFDLQSSQGTSHFKLRSVLESKAEEIERKKFNETVFMAKITGDVSLLDKLDNHTPFKFMTNSERRAQKKLYVNKNWKSLCDSVDSFGQDSLKYDPTSFNQNPETYTLGWMRHYTRNKQSTTKHLTHFLLDEGDASNRVSGSGKNLTCEELWSLNTGNPIGSTKISLIFYGLSPMGTALYKKARDYLKEDAYKANKKKASKACEPFHEITQCLVRLETKVGSVLTDSNRNTPIKESWRSEYIQDDGSFRNVISK